MQVWVGKMHRVATGWCTGIHEFRIKGLFGVGGECTSHWQEFWLQSPTRLVWLTCGDIVTSNLISIGQVVE